MPIALSPQEEEAIKMISPRKFHRRFTLPATEDHGPLRVTYAIAGPEDGDVPTILLCQGMFCTRWNTIRYEHLAQREGVRVVSIDRPGFGGSTPVPLASRLPIFLETISALLASLGIKQVSLVSHSAGTHYALNLLHYHPSLLSPTYPTLTLFSPWVHQSHTSVPLLVAASLLPNPVLNYWDDVSRFIVKRANPTLAGSSGALSALAGFIRGNAGDGTTRKKADDEEEGECQEAYGMSLSVQKELEKLTRKYIFEENTKGVNDEARLCLKSTAGCGWDVCEDCPAFVKGLKESWEEETDAGRRGKLRVTIFFAEEDALVGKRGMAYFRECWTQEKCGRGIEVKCVQTHGTDHDTIMDPEMGFIESVISAAKENEGTG